MQDESAGSGDASREQTIDPPLVVHPDDMDDETFLRHFEVRHNDQLPGLKGFVDTIYQQPEVIREYRTFHDRLHELRQVKERHEHED